MIKLAKKIEEETNKYLDEKVVMVGSSKVFKQLLEKAQGYSNSDENILIYGETGTGKTALAKAIHCLSPRRNFPFINFDCGVLEESLAESELFGHKKGAFTGAIENRTGLLSVANKGTFLIDEIGNLPMNLQTKFLCVTQEKKIRKVGENKDIKLDIRIISATHTNLKKGVKERWFRQDLYSRLNVLTIEVPSLKERGEDVLELANYILSNLNNKYRQKKKLSSDVNDFLIAYTWPENVRELINNITKAYFDCREIVSIEFFSKEIKNASKRGVSPKLSESDAQIKFLLEQIIEGKKDFSLDVHKAYLNRDLNRWEVSELIRMGLEINGGKYKSLSKKFNYNYDKFMGFLRHHNLKPEKMKCRL